MRLIPRLLLVLAGAFSLCSFSTAAQPAYERILVPVFFSGPGAHGSQWWTTVTIANSGDTPLRFSRSVLWGNPECSAVCGCGPSDEVRPQSVNEVCQGYSDPAGLILYMEKTENNVQFGGRIADSSRDQETAGTELKIVREHELRAGSIVLPLIPTGPGFRIGLRLFDTRPAGSPEVILRIHDYPGLSHPFIEEAIPLSLPPDAGEPRPAHAAYAMIGDLVARYPQLKTSHEWISIELILPEPDISPPRKPSYWALATITNNVTQQVTMVTPQ